MAVFDVHPLRDDIAQVVRTELRSPQFGHPAHRELATGTGPCRVCLAPFVIGSDERLLFTYDPFDGFDPVPLPGPVFIHALACTPHATGGFPPQLAGVPLMAEAYRTARECSARVRLTAGGEASVLEMLLDDPTVEYVHLRHAEAGCYVARVSRRAVRESPRPSS